MGLHGEFGCDRGSEVLQRQTDIQGVTWGMMPEARAWESSVDGAETAVGVGSGLLPSSSVVGVLPRIVPGENT